MNILLVTGYLFVGLVISTLLHVTQEDEFDSPDGMLSLVGITVAWPLFLLAAAFFGLVAIVVTGLIAGWKRIGL